MPDRDYAVRHATLRRAALVPTPDDPHRTEAARAIRIRGDRQNNRKNLDLPTGELIVVTGASGSGQRLLVFDTLYAEDQRRCVETVSPHASQFLDRMDRPAVDRIEGVPPAIAIDQTNPVHSGAGPDTTGPEAPATSSPPRVGRRAAAA